jgi:hypothetical protein
MRFINHEDVRDAMNARKVVVSNDVNGIAKLI